MILNEDMLRQSMYGALKELVLDRKYFYHSSVGAQYSELTEEGKEAVLGIISLFAHQIHDAHDIELDSRAKQLVMDGLTKDY